MSGYIWLLKKGNKELLKMTSDDKEIPNQLVNKIFENPELIGEKNTKNIEIYIGIPKKNKKIMKEKRKK